MALNSREFPIEAGRKYRVVITTRGMHGEKCSAYIAIIMLDAAGREICRKIRWLNDFSGRPKEYSVTAAAPAGGVKAVVAYRINTEFAIESEWAGSLPRAEELTLEGIEDSSPEDHDSILDAFETRALLNMRPLTADEEDTIEKNMVWVFGSARSGSSWLTEKLLNHNDIIVWNEPLIGSHIGSLAGKIINVFNEEHRMNIDRTIDVYAEETDYFFSKAYRPVWMPYLRKMILQRLYCQYPTCLRKPVVIKEPNGSLSSDIILQLFPNAKTIILIRDGRDVAASVLDMFKKGSWANKWMQFDLLNEDRRREVIVRQSNSWHYLMTLITSVYENHSPDRRFLIRYEDLRYDTVAWLKKIYDFLGVRIDEEELKCLVDKSSFEKIAADDKGEGKVTRKAKPGSWRETFTEEEKTIMSSIMGEKLREFGYEI